MLGGHEFTSCDSVPIDCDELIRCIATERQTLDDNESRDSMLGFAADRNDPKNDISELAKEPTRGDEGTLMFCTCAFFECKKSQQSTEPTTFVHMVLPA